MTPNRKPQALPEAQPKGYRILRRTQQCANCSTIHEYSQVMLLGELPARNGDITGAKVTQLSTLKGPPQWDLPISCTAMAAEVLPFCHECMGTGPIAGGPSCVSHLPLPPIADTRILRPTWAQSEVAKGDSGGRAARASRSQERKPQLSADDLLAMLDES